MQIAAITAIVPASGSAGRDDVRRLPPREQTRTPEPVVLEGELLGGAAGRREAEAERVLRDEWLRSAWQHGGAPTPTRRAIAAYLDTAGATPARGTTAIDVYA